jgi:hypothetical protein
MEHGVNKGAVVYVRSFSTRRAAIAQVINPTPLPGRDCIEVRLVTDLYAWDPNDAPDEPDRHAGDLVTYASYRIEEVRI